MHSQANDLSHTSPSTEVDGVLGDPSINHGDRLQAVGSTLYTAAFCLNAIRSLLTLKADGLKTVDFAVMSHLISRLLTHETSWVSNSEMAEQLKCDRRTIAESYKRLKAEGWLTRNKNIVRSPKDRGRKIIDRKPATVTVNFDKFPTEVKKADPVSQLAKDIAGRYQRNLSRLEPKAAKYIKARGKSLLEREARAAQKLLKIFNSDVDQVEDFIYYAMGVMDPEYRHFAGRRSLSELYHQRSRIMIEFAGWKESKCAASSQLPAHAK